MTYKISKTWFEKHLKKHPHNPEEHQEASRFIVTVAQTKLIAKFKKEQDLKVAKKQGFKSPYYGAIGGDLTYSFTHTGIGTVLKVTHTNGETLDITDYHNW